MKYFTLTFSLIICLFSCSNDNSSDKLECFNSYLGEDKSHALIELVSSFQNFLDKNYPDENNFEGKVIHFFNDYNTSDRIAVKWSFLKTTSLINKIEQSGLRKELILKLNEKYESEYSIYDLLPYKKVDSVYLGTLDLSIIEEEIIPISKDVSLSKPEIKKPTKLFNQWMFNPNGLFLYGILKCNPKDSFITEYADAKSYQGNISPFIIIDGFMHSITDYDNPFVKRIIAVELYLPLIYGTTE